MLRRLLASIARPKKPAAPAQPAAGLRVALDPGERTALDVGGGPRGFALPKHYAGWRRLMLDIDAVTGPDVLLDARERARLPAGQFDAVYCAHNREHYYEHDVARVLAGFAPVL
ncbi:MAG: hypothetical protein R3357_15205, partial [Burkholderiales bacterium]|nr:hypothetical protein [Burkholderiales bacterium]